MKNIIKHFKGLCNISDDRISIKGLGNGLINDTFKVEITNNSSTQSFVLQKVNHHIFTNVELMQNNIYIVTNHIRQKLIQRGEDNIKNKTLNIIPTLDNKLYYFNGKEYWRMTDFIEDSQSFDLINEKYAYLAGKAFGDFHSMLADLPNNSLKYTIENFHNIEYRIEQFKQSINLDIAARVKEKNKYKVANNTIDIKVEELIIELLSRAELMSKVEQMGRDGLLVKRITHCDTKVNNMLFDNKGKFLCIIDLDTTMPGYVLSDFGDFIRTAANTSAEDEIDTSKIKLNTPIFKSFAKGYIESAQFLTQIEKENLVFGAKLLTYMQCVRFLTDYLNGDTYYKIKYPNHNWVRSIAQFTLLKEVESNEIQMNNYINLL